MTLKGGLIVCWQEFWEATESYSMDYGSTEVEYLWGRFVNRLLQQFSSHSKSFYSQAFFLWYRNLYIFTLGSITVNLICNYFPSEFSSQEQTQPENLTTGGERGMFRKRKPRTAFTRQQIAELELRFAQDHYLTPGDRTSLALRLGLDTMQVLLWFQNRRAKLKRDKVEINCSPTTC